MGLRCALDLSPPGRGSPEAADREDVRYAIFGFARLELLALIAAMAADSNELLANASAIWITA